MVLVKDRFASVKKELIRHIAKLKYDVYMKRVSGILDRAEKKLKSAQEKLNDGEEHKIILAKIKVSQFFIQLYNTGFSNASSLQSCYDELTSGTYFSCFFP